MAIVMDSSHYPTGSVTARASHKSFNVEHQSGVAIVNLRFFYS